MSEAFAGPAAASGGIELAEIKGALLLITVHSLETGISTSFGAKDAIRADVVVLDGEHKGEEHADTLLFPLVLQGQLKSRIGQKVLGRLDQGVAKPGQKPPWILGDYTEADVAIATAHIAGGLVTVGNSSNAAEDLPPF